MFIVTITTVNEKIGGTSAMRAKMYEKYYKMGLSHDLFKTMHLKKPKKRIKTFYYLLMVVILSVALMLF